MTEPADEVAHWLAAARGGSTEALGQLLESYQGYLLLVARRELAPDLQAKGGASDLVQEAFLDAYRDFAQFRGTTEVELRAWLRRLLLNNLAAFTRRYRDTAKRATAAERPLAAGSSSADGANGLIADASSPSTQAMAHEQAEALRLALERLPADYQRVLRLRYEEELPFEEIGRLMDRSANAAEKLWARAVARLQQEMESPP
jgi:RNA polymerase sigma-70 factor (ECF subfamily)